ncbi:hypothetical protein B0T25DRAFT_139983 [Lasiosphaeria hispida]|uniref:DUF7779 domain-containing protein n=1 Tax=Lasiosphaeria hispida TaxID=260671 RepID=A0AAJ0MFJ3_9PEZI|nr:hypothetical protein B0T25DRAFT_139983 [Lasiosphaeria hispida]
MPTTEHDKRYPVPMSLPRKKNPSFTGREGVLEMIESQLWPNTNTSQGSSRKKVTLFGLAGAGKSEVALQYAYQAGAKYKAVFWIRAQNAAELETSATHAVTWIIDHYAENWDKSPGNYQAIATALGMFDCIVESYEDLRKEVAANGSDNITRFKKWLPTTEEWLLILDNYDVPGSCKIDAILPNTGVGHVLITSQNPDVSISDAQIRILPYLGIPESLNLLMNESGSIAACCGGGCKHAMAIVKSVGFLPLAITMIGAYLRELKVTYKSYPGKLEKGLEITDQLDSIWQTSFQRLGPRAKELVQLCSLLNNTDIPIRLLHGGQGDFSWMLDDIAVEQATGELLSLSLISRDLTQGGFSMHSLLHKNARATLHDDRKRLLFSRQVVEMVAATFVVDDSRNADQWVYERSILPHINCCVEMIKCLAPENVPLDDGTRKLLYRFAQCFRHLGDMPKSITLCQRALAGVEPGSMSDPSMVEMMNALGSGLRVQGQFDHAIQWHERAKAFIGKTAITSEPGDMQSHAQQLAHLETDKHIAAILLEKGEFSSAIKELKRVLERQKQLLGEGETVVLDTRNKLGQALINNGDLKGAIAEFRLVYSLRRGQLGSDHPSTLEAANSVAMSLIDMGMHNEALEQYQGILEQQKQSAGPSHHSTLETMEGIASALEHLGRYAEALELYREVYTQMKEVFGTAIHPWALVARNGIAECLFHQAKYSEAKTIYDEVFEGYTSLGMKTSGAWAMKSNIARVHRELGQYDEALSACEEALQGLAELGPTHESILVAKQCKAITLERQYRFAEASTLYGEVLKSDESLGPNHPELLRTKCYMGGLAARSGEYSEALKLLKQVEEGFADANPSHPVALLALRERAGVLAELGRRDGLLDLYQRVCSAKKQAKGDHNPDGRYDPEYYHAVFGQAKLHITEGRYKEGQMCLDEAEGGWKEIFGSPNHPLVLMCLEEQGTTLMEMGDLKKARTLCEQAVQGCQAILGPNHPRTHRAQASLSAVLAKDPDCRREAATMCSASLERLQVDLGKTHLWTLQTMRIQGRIMVRRHRYWKALTLTLKAAHGRRKVSSAVDTI